ncbi:MAG: NfeD family protein [Bacteroidota bacterium]
MTLAGIIALIALGIVLILLEFFVVPGITVAGIGGFLLLVSGVALAYSKYETPGGHYVLAGTVLALVFILSISFKSKTWKKISLNVAIDSKAKEDLSLKIHVGDIGNTVSRLAPTGTVLINDQLVEVESRSGFIDENEKVEVIKIKLNKIIVKLKI